MRCSPPSPPLAATQVLELEPGNPKAIFRRGQARSGAGDWAGAARDLQLVVEAQPDNRVRPTERQIRRISVPQRALGFGIWPVAEGFSVHSVHCVVQIAIKELAGMKAKLASAAAPPPKAPSRPAAATAGSRKLNIVEVSSDDESDEDEPAKAAPPSAKASAEPAKVTPPGKKRTLAIVEVGVGRHFRAQALAQAHMQLVGYRSDVEA